MAENRSSPPVFTSVTIPEIDSIGGVFAIAQDHQGFLWFGGKNGLRRYDGYKVDVFRHNPEDPTSISTNDISDLFIDSKGRLWIGTNSGGGLNQFDFATETFIHYQRDASNAHSIGSNDIYSMLEDENGDLWLSTYDNGLNKLDHKTGKFHRYPLALPGVKDGGVRDIGIDSLGYIWAATNNYGLYRISPKRDQFSHFEHKPEDPSSLSDNHPYRVHVDRYDNVWVGTTQGGLNLLDREGGGFIKYQHDPDVMHSLGRGMIWDIGEDLEGNLWIATGSGTLSRYNKWQNNFENYGQDPYAKNAISGKVIRMFLDNSGDLWFGTYSSELNRISERGAKFELIDHNPINTNSLSSKVIYALAEAPDKTLWVGSENGLTSLDPSGKQYKRYYHEENNINSLSDSYIRALAIDTNGHVWVSTGAGISIFDPVEATFQTMKEKFGVAPKDDKIWSIFVDSLGMVWIGTQEEGLFRFNPENKKMTAYNYNLDDPFNISHQYIWTILEDSKGKLWVGTQWGLNFMDKELGTFKAYHQNKDDPNSLSDNSVRGLAEDSKGNIWVATTSGLNKFDPLTLSFDIYRSKDGLADDSISAVVVDDDGFVWVTTQKGIARLNPDTKVIRNYDVRHGIAGNAHPRKAAALKRSNGDLMFAGANGITSVNPYDIKDNIFIPPVVFTDFYVNNEKVQVNVNDKSSILKANINIAKKVILDHTQNVFSIEFSALNYMVAEQNLYQYKLVGFDTSWQKSTGSQRRATYTNLDAGHYTFLVKGSNNEGVWNETPTQLYIEIRPPWWKTWWAYVFYCVIFFGVVYVMFSIKRKQLKIQKMVDKRLSDIDKLKQQFLANVSDELTTPLNTIIGLTENLLDGGGGEIPAKAHQHILIINENSQKLSALAQDMSDFSSFSFSDNKLNIRPLHLEPILEGVVKWFQPHAEKKSLKLYMNIEGDLPELEADYSCLQKILFNVIDNAIKFTHHGYVDVIARSVEDNILIQVTDTGIGVDSDKKDSLFTNTESNDDAIDSGVGLQRTQHLVELHDGSIHLEATSSGGSMFVIRLPLIQKNHTV